MSADHPRIDLNLAKAILELYSEASGYPVGLYEGGKLIVPERSAAKFQPFCQKLCQFDPHNRCEADHRRRGSTSIKEGFEMCHAGLFNYTLPISVDNQIMATILCGQTRLTDDIQEIVSKDRRLQIYSDLRLHSEQRTELEKLYHQIPRLDPRLHEIPLLDHLWAIQEQFYELISLDLKNVHERELFAQSRENTAHEFQIQLQGLWADSENLFRSMGVGRPISQQMKADAGEVLRGVQRLNVLVQNLGIALGDYEWRDTNIGSLIRESVALYEAVAQRKFIVFEVNIEDAILVVSDMHIAHALNNLVHNAVKYSYTGTHNQRRSVKIHGKALDGSYQIEIENYGVGILPHERDDIFKKGYRGELTRDERRTGAGLGLAIVKDIIEAHDGTIRVRSNSVGSDAHLICFTIMLHRQPLSRR